MASTSERRPLNGSGEQISEKKFEFGGRFCARVCRVINLRVLDRILKSISGAFNTQSRYVTGMVWAHRGDAQERAQCDTKIRPSILDHPWPCSHFNMAALGCATANFQYTQPAQTAFAWGFRKKDGLVSSLALIMLHLNSYRRWANVDVVRVVVISLQFVAHIKKKSSIPAMAIERDRP